MRLLVIDDLYPSSASQYADQFVRTRVMAYRPHFKEIQVVSSFWQAGPEFSDDGIDVVRAGSHDRLEAIARDYAPDVILVHFATFHVIRKLIDRLDAPYVVWSHGFDAVGWWRRLYQWRPLRAFARYAADNMIQRWFYRRLLIRANRTGRIAMIYVSQWLKRVAEKDCGVRLKEAHIIPNPIDTRQFAARSKGADQRFRWLTIRPVAKSGFDILTDALLELSGEPWFENVDMHFVGEGIRGSRFDRLLGHYPTVSMDDRSISQREIADLHGRYGVFLTPTMQDSHGVSMCEAMASGLVVVACNNSAIPEYVEQGVTGIATATNARAYAQALRQLIRDPEAFLAMSRAAPPAVTRLCGIDRVITQEVAVIRDVARRS